MSETFEKRGIVSLEEFLKNLAEEFRASGARFVVIWRDKVRKDQNLEHMKNSDDRLIACIVFGGDYVCIGDDKELSSEKVIRYMKNHGFTADNIVTEYIIWKKWYDLFHLIKNAAKNCSTDRVAIYREQKDKDECKMNLSNFYKGAKNEILCVNGAVFVVKAGQIIPPEWFLSWIITNGWQFDKIIIEPVPNS